MELPLRMTRGAARPAIARNESTSARRRRRRASAYQPAPVAAKSAGRCASQSDRACARRAAEQRRQMGGERAQRSRCATSTVRAGFDLDLPRHEGHEQERALRRVMRISGSVSWPAGRRHRQSGRGRCNSQPASAPASSIHPAPFRIDRMGSPGSRRHSAAPGGRTPPTGIRPREPVRLTSLTEHRRGGLTVGFEEAEAGEEDVAARRRVDLRRRVDHHHRIVVIGLG